MKQNNIPGVYKLTPQNYENIFNVYIDEDKNYYYNLLRTINFPEDLDPSTYTLYTIQHKDTWPLIAWKSYNNVKLWWLICAANQIINPTEWPTPGIQLKIINTNTVRNLLNNLKDS